MKVLAGLGIVLVLASPVFADKKEEVGKEGANASLPLEEELEEQSSKGCLLELGRFPISGQFVPIHSSEGTLDEQVVVSRYGRPKTRHSSTLPDAREAGANNEHLELSYAEFTVQLSRPTVPPQGRYWMERLRIIDRRLALPCNLHVGAPLAVFIDALGPPGYVHKAPDDRMWLWQEIQRREGFSLARHANITIHMATGGTVEWIEWYYYAD